MPCSRPSGAVIAANALKRRDAEALGAACGRPSVATSLGTRGAEYVEVTQGLSAGQTVVRTGHQKLFPGAKVMPVGAEGAGGAAPEGAGS